VGLSGRRLATQAADNECHCFELFARFRPDRCGVDGCRNSPLETTVPHVLGGLDWLDWLEVVTQQHCEPVGGAGATLRTLEAVVE
jgi:hypothetical protein